MQNRKCVSTNKGSISDFVGFNFRNSEVNYGAKATGGYTAMRWDGQRSWGALADYTSALKGPNITGFYAWMKPKTVTILSATATVVNASVDAATDAANEATDAANAATDAALAAADAADAATAAAQDASDAVAALSATVAKLVASLKAQITSLTNLVIKIQKKVRA